ASLRWWSLVVSPWCVLRWLVRWDVGVERVDEASDEALPRAGRRQVEVDGAEQEEAEPDRVAEAHDSLGVERRVDRSGGLGLGHQVGQPIAAEVQRLLHQP